MIYLLAALLAGAVAFGFTRRIVPTIVNALVIGLLTYFVLPTLAWGYWGSLFYLVIILGGGWAWTLAFDKISDREKIGGVIGVGAVAVLGLLLIPMFTSWSLFHSTTYRDLLQVEEKDFETDQVLLDQSQARFVDETLALRRATELVGERQGLTSQVEVGTLSIQSVNGKLMWVAPLKHKGLGKWFFNTTTPGYVWVSATSYADADLVLEHDLKLGTGGFFFGSNLSRYMYQNGFATTGYEDFTFELDDSGKPHYVVTLIAPQVGFGGFVATGVAVIDPVSGEINRYGIDNAPDWIDRIQPMGITNSRIDDWGDFVHGFWNSLFAEKDVLNASQGTSLVYTRDGRSAWYTGLQGTGSNEGTMGFMLVDTRTGKASFYRRAGITEAAAKAVIEGQVQEKGYNATWPIPYLVDGVPTFISVLKDNAGNAQMYGMVRYDNRQVLAVGTSLRAALRTYASSNRGRGTSIALNGEVELMEFEGTIVSMRQEVIGNETVFYIRLNTVPNKMFLVQSALSAEIFGSDRGSNVKLSALDTGSGVINVDVFDNTDFQLEETEDDAAVRATYEEAREAAAARQDRINAEQVLDEVDPETLRKILEAIRAKEEGQ